MEKQSLHAPYGVKASNNSHMMSAARPALWPRLPSHATDEAGPREEENEPQGYLPIVALIKRKSAKEFPPRLRVLLSLVS